jgi:hypothetical protein
MALAVCDEGVESGERGRGLIGSGLCCIIVSIRRWRRLRGGIGLRRRESSLHREKSWKKSMRRCLTWSIQGICNR